MKHPYLLLLLLPAISACHCNAPATQAHAPVSFNGTYEFSSDAHTNNHRVIRDGWTWESWKLEINDTKGQLEFHDPRGLYYCDLAVRVQQSGECATVFFDSICSKALLADEKINTLRKGNFLLKLSTTGHGPVIVWQYVTRLQKRNRGGTIAFFEKTTASAAPVVSE